MSSGDIAIVGMACRFAGDSTSPEAFHEMLRQRRDAWGKIPKSRFNAEAFNHPSTDRSGTMVCEGGYFLNQDVTKWDAAFFACPTSEAPSYDPQQRMLLEVAYESLESAGIPISKFADTDAACFIGGFSEDYKLIVSRELDSMPKYAKTGTALSILSNRLSWFFNLHGASVTCDTACSSSLAALHLACETIRSDGNPSRTALVGGANLILDPDDQCGLNALGFFSPAGRCFSFDSRASGYARGEGVAVLVLKHIDDAIRDGDPIRAVIRGSGLNSDGRTAGITLPSTDAQSRLILNTYRMANLDPADTQYVELHGTGTKAGDNAEVRAISSTIASRKDQPLYCGSVKSRIGHTEASSGMAAVIRCVLALEKGVITPNLNFEKSNPRLRLDDSNIIVPTTTIPWPACETRRCSVNNFGFGGTNSHIILEDAYNYLRLNRSTQKKIAEPRQQPRVFVLSAPEQTAIERQRLAYADHTQSHSDASVLPALSRTLSERRSIFQWRHAVVASSVDDLVSRWNDKTNKPMKALSVTNLCFVFTGQGAQWYAMGRELATLPQFVNSVKRSATHLQEMGCAWDAWSELMGPQSEAESKVKQAEYSQPLCLVLQMALTDLLAHWGVKPTAVIGHSSGEIAAAYAAGALSREECLAVAYHRGLVSKLAQVRQPGGSMLAAGISAEAAKQYLADMADSVVVACVNSPESVTLSGDKSALIKVQESLNQDKKFNRLLHVENAYHSPQMRTVAEDYAHRIKGIKPTQSESLVAFYSTVHGRQVATSTLVASYWVENLCSPVRFTDALDDMMFVDVANKKLQDKSKAPNVMFEVGPSSALAGPIKQYRAHRHGIEKLVYNTMLVRGEDAAVTAMNAAGALWSMGSPVRLDKVNNVEESTEILTNLPTYRWNHSTSYWHEGRQSRNHRLPQFARHDLIGSLLESYNPTEPVWKNHLRVADLPWLKDHKIHSDIVFPAAGMICSVIEAARQLSASENPNQSISAFELRELSVSRALVIPDTSTGVEVYVNLKRRKLGLGSGAGVWFEFSYYSCQANDAFVEHAAGLLQLHYPATETEVDAGKESRAEIVACNDHWETQRALCTDRVARSSHYKFCDEQGLHFGKTFQGLRSAQQNGSTVAFETTISDTRACMPSFKESNYIMHPTTLDAIFQAMMIAVPRMESVEKQIWVPTGAASMLISTDINRNYGGILKGLAESSLTAIREMTASVLIKDEQRQGSLPEIVIDSFRFTGLGSTQETSEQQSIVLASKLYSAPAWMPDAAVTDAKTLREMSNVEDFSSGMVKFCTVSDNLLKRMCRIILQKLGARGLDESLPLHLRKYVAWMQKQNPQKDVAAITPPHSPDKNASFSELLELPDIKGFMEEYPVDGELLFHVYESLGAVFAQEVTPISVLRQDDLLDKAYQSVYGLQANVELMKTWFTLKAHKQPAMRILEIGAGTASSTLPLMKQLTVEGSSTPLFSSWTFTDISAGWFESAKNTLGAWSGRVEYKVLDIDADPSAQGFELDSYDIVLAVNVLHATKDIQKTLVNCRSLLKPGGNLVLGEYTNPNDIANFVFGILPGWWAAEDSRTHGPLLRQGEWHDALTKAGFSGADMALADSDDPSAHRMSTIISTKPRSTTALKDIVVIIPEDCSDATKSVAMDICHEFRLGGHKAMVKNINQVTANIDGKSVIALLDYEAPFFGNMSEERFEQAKQLLLRSQETLWVTRSEPTEGPGHPAKRMISGVMRCLQMEDSSRNLYELHLSRTLDGGEADTSRIIFDRLNSIWESAQDEGQVAEMETEERNGCFYIPRHMPLKAMNDSLACATKSLSVGPQMGKLVQEGRPLKLTIAHPGMLDTMHFVDDPKGGEPLGELDVEVEVKTCALNFLDIMIAMGQIPRPELGHEACGVVSRTGRGVTEVSLGDRVVFVGPGAMKTHLRANQSNFLKIPDNMTLEEGASIPIAYATAYRSLVEVARLQRGESVLIHAAAGGLGQALIQIALMLSGEIYCTVGSAAKKQAIMDLGVQEDRIFSSRDVTFAKGIKRVTAGRGVDVVVNSLAGEALRQSWLCLAPYGRFIEVGKKDILGNSGLDMEPFLKNTIFAGVNLEAMMVEEPQRCREIVLKVMKLFEQDLLQPIKPITTHDFTEMEKVFRDMQRGAHTGKLILQVTDDSTVPILPRSEVPLSLSLDATYVLVGGLGGIGRAQAVFMAKNGARHLAFISRSGAASEKAKDVLKTLIEAGVDARTYVCDISDKTKLQQILGEISSSMPPIRGVIQGAMVLADSLFHRMTYDQWTAATGPKVQGTWNLHELLPAKLDFFIVLSSLAGIIGSVSQGNYAAGNTFQDALVRYRRAKGLTAQSLDIGVMADIGYVEENQDARARTSQLRVTTLGEQQFMHLLRCAMASSPNGSELLEPQVLAGAGSGGLQQLTKQQDDNADFYWLRSLAAFAYLERMDEQNQNADGEASLDETSLLISKLKACVSMDEANDVSQQLLMTRVARNISVPASDLSADKPIHTYGVDSLVAVELRNWLARELKSELTIFDLTGSDPISEVSKKIACRSKLLPAAARSEVTA